MEQVHISWDLLSRFTQKCILKGTKFRENCQNTDLYRQSQNWPSSETQELRVDIKESSRFDLKSTHSPWVSEDENWHD